MCVFFSKTFNKFVTKITVTVWESKKLLRNGECSFVEVGGGTLFRWGGGNGQRGKNWTGENFYTLLALKDLESFGGHQVKLWMYEKASRDNILPYPKTSSSYHVQLLGYGQFHCLQGCCHSPPVASLLWCHMHSFPQILSYSLKFTSTYFGGLFHIQKMISGMHRLSGAIL